MGQKKDIFTQQGELFARYLETAKMNIETLMGINYNEVETELRGIIAVCAIEGFKAGVNFAEQFYGHEESNLEIIIK